ncbi:DJ-1/PfpI family protein [Pedobacter aquatilis]|uniref:DJ-1/PfpI family protein n=1 Tax=Pedobacter aquatilis TaxID=351343 RepID=UPI0029300414|nr:DJ-1/PfpI family protein [Pedobacter aquatilis]
MKKLILIALTVISVLGCKNKNKEESNEFPKPKTNIKTVGILLYDNYAVLDAMGPYHVFSELMGAKVFFVGVKKGTIATAGMKVWCDTSINEVKQLDILVIPGGLNETYTLTKDTKLLNWIREIDAGSKYTTSVCTGAWILAATGLLKDREATTHWFGKQLLKDEFGITGQNKRYVQSGKYFTSAGVSAGIDMSLAVVNDIMGEKYTKMVMLDLEYDPQPPVKGGREDNTDAKIVSDMRSMYNGALETVLHPGASSTGIKIDNKIDPVCHMAVSAGVKDTVHHEGKIFGFCSSSCKSRFKDEPKAYLPVK